MINLKLNINEYSALFTVYNALDSHDEPTKVNGTDMMYRVPYVLGSSRRIIAKNMLAIKKIVDDFDMARKSMLSECWLDVPQNINIQTLKPSDFPLGVHEKFKTMVNEAAETVDEKGADLIELPYKIFDTNEFPLFAVAALLEYRLITELSE